MKCLNSYSKKKKNSQKTVTFKGSSRYIKLNRNMYQKNISNNIPIKSDKLISSHIKREQIFGSHQGLYPFI